MKVRYFKYQTNYVAYKHFDQLQNTNMYGQIKMSHSFIYMSIQIDMESQQHQIVLFRPGISNQPIFVLIRDIAVPT